MVNNDEIQLLIHINKYDYDRIINGFANEDDAIMFENLFKNGVRLDNDNLNDAPAIIRRATELLMAYKSLKS